MTIMKQQSVLQCLAEMISAYTYNLSVVCYYFHTLDGIVLGLKIKVKSNP